MDSLDEQTLRKRRDKASWVPGRERRDYLLNQVGGQQALIEPAPPLPWEAASLGLQFMPRPVQVGDFGAQASARNNLTLMICFRTRSKRELDNLVDAVSGMVDEEAFLKVWEECSRGGDPHTALLIDKHPKRNHPSPFRRGLDTFLILE